MTRTTIRLIIQLTARMTKRQQMKETFELSSLTRGDSTRCDSLAFPLQSYPSSSTAGIHTVYMVEAEAEWRGSRSGRWRCSLSSATLLHRPTIEKNAKSARWEFFKTTASTTLAHYVRCVWLVNFCPLEDST